MSTASKNLKFNQRQLDADGCEVGVSRQAIDETLAQYDALVSALRIILAFYEPGQKHLDTNAWKSAEAGGRAALAAAVAE